MKARKALITSLLPLSFGLLMAWSQNGISSIFDWNLSTLLVNVINGLTGKNGSVGYVDPIYNKVVTSLMLVNPVLYGVVLYRDFRRLRTEF